MKRKGMFIVVAGKQHGELTRVPGRDGCVRPTLQSPVDIRKVSAAA